MGDDRSPLLRWLSGLRLWSLCGLSVALAAWLVWSKAIDAATYASITTAALYAFAGRDGVVQGTEKWAAGKQRAATTPTTGGGPA